MTGRFENEPVAGEREPKALVSDGIDGNLTRGVDRRIAAQDLAAARLTAVIALTSEDTNSANMRKSAAKRVLFFIFIKVPYIIIIKNSLLL